MQRSGRIYDEEWDYMIITSLTEKKAEKVSAHDGEGKISFRRVEDEGYKSAINFLDYTIMPPHTSIGYHQHIGNEETYIVLSGTGMIKINDIERRVNEKDVIIANDGDWHGLVNDSNENLELLVFEGNIVDV